ncbi:MAG: Asp-tRNA(Asn)/Glu-tRNA(Gln) amidotransferase subunit GatC [Patescibacteria group bacterium]|nr:MAG: Asp-tRNA(Asn)/Glu-tRNA(Gln) amidotransferase subunit GatC [Patescibacteria group bacterium]
MKKTPNITKKQIQHIANLANIPITQTEQKKLQTAFEETLNTIAELQSVDISNVEPTHQVTGLTNILREDIVNIDNMFTQKQALANAKQTHNGYFVVPRIIEEK